MLENGHHHLEYATYCYACHGKRAVRQTAQCREIYTKMMTMPDAKMLMDMTEPL